MTLPDHEPTDRRATILDAVARIAERMPTATSLEELVPDSLRILGEATGVSRVYLFETIRRSPEEAVVAQRFEWVAPGVARQIDNPDLREVPLEASGFGRWRRLLEAGQPVCGDVGEFPASEQPLLAAQAIQSVLVQPVFSSARWWGFLGLDACAQRMHWERAESHAVRIAALVMGSVIHHLERDAQLRQALTMEALGRMAGGVAHDFNNVLQVATGRLELIEHQLATGAPQLEVGDDLEVLKTALDQAAGLTRRLLDFSRKREAAPELLSPGTLLASDLALLQHAAGPRVALRFQPAPDVAPVRFDPVEFGQVVLNLTLNARDAMPRGGALDLSVSTLDAQTDPARADHLPPGRWTMVRVRDTGEGMTAEVKERLFEPFFTTKSSEAPGVTGGIGLGLSTVYAAVRRAGGHIAVTSAPGEGAEFRVYLPVAEPASTG